MFALSVFGGVGEGSGGMGGGRGGDTEVGKTVYTQMCVHRNQTVHTSKCPHIPDSAHK